MITINATKNPTPMNGVIAFTLNESIVQGDRVSMTTESEVADYIRSFKLAPKDGSVPVLFVSKAVKDFFYYKHIGGDNFAVRDSVLVMWERIKPSDAEKYLGGDAEQKFHIFNESGYGTTFDAIFQMKTSLADAVSSIVGTLEGFKAEEDARKNLDKSNAERLAEMLNY